MNLSDRRLFNRINFHTEIHLCQGKHAWVAKMVDISLKGLLALLPSPDGAGQPDIDPQLPVHGTIHLSEDAVIELTLKLAHSTDRQFGFYCENIDLEGISHLRRLIELNTGNPEASERELSELINQSLFGP